MSATLIERRATLTARLNDGWNRIQQAEAIGQEVTGWGTLWLQLLSEYEGVCQQLDALSATSSTVPQPSRDEQQAPLMNARGAW